MKKLLIFGAGVLTGVVLTIVFAFVFSAVQQTKELSGAKLFEKPGEVIEVNSFQVFQVIGDNSALVNGGEVGQYSGMELFIGPIFVITNDEGKYYYDEEIIRVPKNKVVRQVGIYKYRTNSGMDKTVPIIKILEK